jgi:hypothetical protein
MKTKRFLVISGSIIIFATIIVAMAHFWGLNLQKDVSIVIGATYGVLNIAFIVKTNRRKRKIIRYLSILVLILISQEAFNLNIIDMSLLPFMFLFILGDLIVFIPYIFLLKSPSNGDSYIKKYRRQY